MNDAVSYYSEQMENKSREQKDFFFGSWQRRNNLLLSIYKIVLANKIVFQNGFFSFLISGSILDNGHGAAYTTGRHASLMATTSSAGVRSNGGASSGSAGSGASRSGH